MQFRTARAEDAPRLIELIDQLGYKIAPNVLEQNIGHYGAGAFLLEDGGEIVGCLAYHILPQFHSHEKHMRIVSLVVDQKRRGIGFGKKLLQEAERIACEKECSVIELTSASHRLKSHEFYTNQGYKADGQKLYFRKLLS